MNETLATAAAKAAYWQSALAAIRDEWRVLDGAERAWIDAAVAEIGLLQQQLQALVDAADGAAACRDCAGGCCGHGTYHLTLANVLAHLVRGHELPVPDFARSCPWLAEAGCSFAAALRPFNCVTFVCEAIDARLPPAACAPLERRLRALYAAFDQRYQGSSLRGLLNVAAGRPQAFLARRRV